MLQKWIMTNTILTFTYLTKKKMSLSFILARQSENQLILVDNQLIGVFPVCILFRNVSHLSNNP